MMVRLLTLIGGLALLLPAAAQNVVERHYSGSAVDRRISKASTIDWHRRFEDLRKAAKARNKLIFWLQIVGRLDAGL